MDHICFALPLLPDKTQEAREFQRALDGSRKAEYAASEQRIGIVKEHWFLQQTPQGDLLLAYRRAPTLRRRWGSSRTPRRRSITGSKNGWLP